MINKLSQINLNLLLVLDALLADKNTTLAAKRLNLSQPTISYELKQLRDIFDDELLIKNAFNKNMSLTPLGKSLIAPVKNTIRNLELIFTYQKFNPKTSRRHIKIATTDLGLSGIVSGLIAKARTTAPFISFEVFDLFQADIKGQLMSEDIDVAIGMFNLDEDQSILSYEKLFSEEVLCWADKNHPAFKGTELTLKHYLNYPHILMRLLKYGWLSQYDNEKLYDITYTGNLNNIVIHSTSEVMCLLPGSDYICLGGRRFFSKYAEFYGLKALPPPFEIPDAPISLCRRKDKDKDDAVIYVISMIREIAAEFAKK